MADLTGIMDFFEANAVSIFALIVSSLALFLTFRSYRHGSRADVEISVKGDWCFDPTVSHVGAQHVVEDRGKIGQVFVKNKGGVKTTLEALYIKRFTRLPFRRMRKICIAPRGDVMEFIGTKRYDQYISWLSFTDVVIEPGGRVPFEAYDRAILKLMSENSLFDATKQNQGRFTLMLTHTFNTVKSNPFQIVLSKPALRFLQVGCDERAFVEDFKKTKS
jgi:hypothetical protein